MSAAPNISTSTLAADSAKTPQTVSLILTLTPHPDGDEDSDMCMGIGLHCDRPPLSEILSHDQATDLIWELTRPIGEWLSMRQTPGTMSTDQVREWLADDAENGFKKDVSQVFDTYGLQWKLASVKETEPGEIGDWIDDAESYCESFVSESTAVGSVVDGKGEEGKEEPALGLEVAGGSRRGSWYPTWMRTCLGGRD